MAYSAVPTVSTGDLWTAANHNTYIRDNFIAGVPDIITTKGDLVVGTGADAATRMGVGSDGKVIEARSAVSQLGMQWHSGWFAKASRSTAQSINSGSITLIQYDTEDDDPDSIQTLGASYHIVTPYAGLYLCIVKWSWASASWAVGNQVDFYVYNGGSSELLFTSAVCPITATWVFAGQGLGIVNVAAGVSLDVRVNHNAGAARSINTWVEWAFIR